MLGFSPPRGAVVCSESANDWPWTLARTGSPTTLFRLCSTQSLVANQAGTKWQASVSSRAILTTVIKGGVQGVNPGLAYVDACTSILWPILDSRLWPEVLDFVSRFCTLSESEYTRACKNCTQNVWFLCPVRIWEYLWPSLLANKCLILKERVGVQLWWETEQDPNLIKCQNSKGDEQLHRKKWKSDAVNHCTRG